MAVYFVSADDGDDTDDGTTMDDGAGGGVGAWATLDHALESGGLAAGDTVFIRRTHGEVPASIITMAYAGTAVAPIVIMGWPRPAIPNTTITEGDFTNGSHVIDNVVGITPTRTSHIGRYITAPDGEQYLITAVLWEAGIDGMGAGDEFEVGARASNATQTKKGKIWGFTDDLDTTGTIQYARDSATAWVEDDNITDDGGAGGSAEIDAGGETAVGFLIDREYAGSTVTGVSGKFQIEADEDWVADMGTAYGFDDSGWTIKEITWDADAIDLPLIDFNDGNFSITNDNKIHTIYKYMEVKDSTYASGMFYIDDGVGHLVQGCLFKQTTQSDQIVRFRYPFNSTVDRCIIEGSGAGTSQRGIYLASGILNVNNSAIYNCGDNGITGVDYCAYLDNVNLGIEIPNADEEVELARSFVYGKDVLFGAWGGYFANVRGGAYIENYQKVLGDHKSWFVGGEYGSAAVSGEFPNPKLSATVLKITPNIDLYEFTEGLTQVKIPLGEINADAGSQTFKFWIYNKTGVTLNNGDATADFYLQADYVKSYDDTTEYTMATATSAEHTIADAGADADDWDYLSVTINPAVESKVRLYLRISIYDTNDIFVDPQVVIT